ncbi:MAG: beta-galactosidase [Anaerolineales bacterium]|nr:beta-galactosidase [Anaerolineales bacterium]
MSAAYHPSQKIYFGAAYYPEHWPEDRWPEDIRLMQEAGMTVSRLAEFAWSTMEPAAGEFDFDWLEKVIEMLAEAGMETVLGTPTAAPPAWLVTAHPGVLAVDESGRKVQFGNRCHYCVNSVEFHKASARIVRAMAERFGDNPHVIGWQLDNEYNRVCYCEHCQKRFQEFLIDTYGTLDALNQYWSTAYWSQTYSAWEQIPIPIGYHNPGLLLAFKRFITASYRAFQQMQIDVLREYIPEETWITHNFMKWYDLYDHYEMSADLDLASWDWYVGTGYTDYRSSGAAHDLVRGFKRQNFWLMETQPAHVNWTPLNNVLYKGEGRANAWHAIGHGADAVLYWQWRSAYGGQEQYHGALVDQSGQPRPFYSEAQMLGRDLEKVSDLLAGSTVKAPVAILFDYESKWAFEWQRHHQDFDYIEHLLNYYRPFARRNIPVDIIPADASLDGYKLVIAPALNILTPERVEKLADYVEHNGKLVLTVRTGMKDEYNALLPNRQPGPLAEIAGVEVEDYYALTDPVLLAGQRFQGNAHIWAERLRILDESSVNVMASYGAANGWLDGAPAVTVRYTGRGFVYYFGAYLEDNIQDNTLGYIANFAGIRPVLEVPEGVEVCRRITPAGTDVYIVINHTRGERVVELPWSAQEHLSGLVLEEGIKLRGYSVAVLTKTKQEEI